MEKDVNVLFVLSVNYVHDEYSSTVQNVSTFSSQITRLMRFALEREMVTLADPGGGAAPHPKKFKAPDIQVKWL